MQRIACLALFCTGYARPHFLAALCALKYMCTAKDKKRSIRGLISAPGDSSVTTSGISIFSDYDGAMGLMDCKFYAGNAIDLDGDTVAWSTHRQEVVTVSSSEAEYIAVSDACNDGLNIFQF